ncbi:MAG: glycosyltransferase family 8 protein [Fusobacterium sp.]|nr:glycosyltransferase family 8 protein [Fusobacterium sp.]
MDKVFQIEPVFESSWTRTIVFAPDNNFVKYFGVALQSLIENSKNYEDYDIIVLEADISERNKNVLLKMLPPNFSLRFFNINEYINQKFENITFKTCAAWPLSTYYRLFIPLLMQKYKKVLYCDVDLVFNDYLEDLFKLDFEGAELMAVLDTVSPVLSYDKHAQKHFTQELKLQHPEKYFNSGVIMFNIPQIDIRKYSQEFQKIIANMNLFYFDQDVLNIIFAGKTRYLSSKWNFQWGVYFQPIDYENIITDEYKEDFLNSKQHPAIIHYTTPNKPWNSPKEYFAEIFWYYARKCPFYEEMLCNILKIYSINKFAVFFNYNSAKILSRITFGKLREYFTDKRNKLKRKIRDIRKFSRL